MSSEPSEAVHDLDRLGEVLESFRPRLERMVALRIHPRLRQRTDAADLVQEAFLSVATRLEQYRAQRPMPFFLWVRFLVVQQLLEFHRRHLEVGMRDARLEQRMPGIPAASSSSMARALCDTATSVLHALEKQEAVARVQRCLDEMDALDREVLVLRYFEQLSNEEAAAVLGLSSSGARKRHVRALAHLRVRLGDAWSGRVKG